MIESVESAWTSARHAIELVVTDVTAVSPGWVVAGVLLHVLHQVTRTRGWFNIIRAAHPDERHLRARDVTFAYLAGSGLNAVLPARGGDVVKLYLVRRRAPGTRWSTLFGTFVPETLFETLVGIGLVAWALAMGFLPVPRAPHEVPSIDVSFLIRHPFLSAAGAAAGAAGSLVLYSAFRRRGRILLSRFREGLAILGRPRSFVRQVVAWQALARLIRLGSLACLMAAFALPVAFATVVLVMAAQGGGRIIPLAPVSAGLRIAMLSYGFVEVTGQSVDIARITAFSFGTGAALFVSGLAISLAVVGHELGGGGAFKLLRGLRVRVGKPAEPWSPGDPAASPRPAR